MALRQTGRVARMDTTPGTSALPDASDSQAAAPQCIRDETPAPTDAHASVGKPADVRASLVVPSVRDEQTRRALRAYHARDRVCWLGSTVAMLLVAIVFFYASEHRIQPYEWRKHPHVSHALAQTGTSKCRVLSDYEQEFGVVVLRTGQTISKKTVHSSLCAMLNTPPWLDANVVSAFEFGPLWDVCAFAALNASDVCAVIWSAPEHDALSQYVEGRAEIVLLQREYNLLVRVPTRLVASGHTFVKGSAAALHIVRTMRLSYAYAQAALAATTALGPATEWMQNT